MSVRMGLDQFAQIVDNVGLRWLRVVASRSVVPPLRTRCADPICVFLFDRTSSSDNNTPETSMSTQQTSESLRHRQFLTKRVVIATIPGLLATFDYGDQI